MAAMAVGLAGSAVAVLIRRGQEERTSRTAAPAGTASAEAGPAAAHLISTSDGIFTAQRFYYLPERGACGRNDQRMLLFAVLHWEVTEGGDIGPGFGSGPTHDDFRTTRVGPPNQTASCKPSARPNRIYVNFVAENASAPSLPPSNQLADCNDQRVQALVNSWRVR
jgi:hypothetical protein